MVAPLGGYRRSRKLLKRCAHRHADSWADVSSADRIVACRDCDSVGRVSPAGGLVGYQASAVHPRAFIPPKIAKKASDA